MTTLAELVPILLEKSREGKIKWDSLSGTSFIARLGQMAVEVFESRDNTFVRLRREDGAIIETISFSESLEPVDRLIMQLYDSARRKALAIDQTLNNLKNILDSL